MKRTAVKRRRITMTLQILMPETSALFSHRPDAERVRRMLQPLVTTHERAARVERVSVRFGRRGI